jgi:Histidine kinase-, DNA gyrase B-, and HSP90-like ATPase
MQVDDTLHLGQAPANGKQMSIIQCSSQIVLRSSLYCLLMWQTQTIDRALAIEGLRAPMQEFPAPGWRKQTASIGTARPAQPVSAAQQTQPNGIWQLPMSAALGVQGGYSVHSFTQAVEQLCANSIDAGARSVAVHFDAAQLTATVSDDGAGIPAASFPSLGVRFCTSKQRQLASAGSSSGCGTAAATPNSTAAGQAPLVHKCGPLGSRGVFLASLAEVARVEIVSKAAGSFETYRKVLHASAHVAVRAGCWLSIYCSVSCYRLSTEGGLASTGARQWPTPALGPGATTSHHSGHRSALLGLSRPPACAAQGPQPAEVVWSHLLALLLLCIL